MGKYGETAHNNIYAKLNVHSPALRDGEGVEVDKLVAHRLYGMKQISFANDNSILSQKGRSKSETSCCEGSI